MTPIEASSHFPAVGVVSDVTPMAGGHIHRTWRLASATGRWVVQACNTRVFGDMASVMANTVVVCTEVCPDLMPCITRHGDPLWSDAAGTPWRVRPFVEGRVMGIGEMTDGVVRQLGAALGRFHRDTATIDPRRLRVTLVGFHDPAARLAALDEVSGESPDAAALGGFRWLADAAGRMRPPEVPERIAHFDAKADNFVWADGAVRTLIDLDTVMPGSILWDVGDLARSTTGTAAEDAPDRMTFDATRWAALVEGYLSAAEPLLARAERDALALAPLVATFEQAVRFLTDHLSGDAYYGVDRPGQNLDRFAAQLALLNSMAAAL